MYCGSLLLGILACGAAVASAANILALLPTASPSHHIWNSPLMLALERRGHNLTVVGPQRTKGAGPNLTDLAVENLYAGVAEGYDYEKMAEDTTDVWITEVFAFLESSCVIVQQSAAFQQLMDYPPDFKFDLIIIESFGAECLFGAFPKFGSPPIVVINAFGIQKWIREMMGSPNIPSYMPHSMLRYTDKMTFGERAWNLFFNVYAHYWYHHSFLPRMEWRQRQFFGKKGWQPCAAVLDNVSVALSNFNPALDYSWPSTPNLIGVGGMQIGEPKPLPQELQEYIDGAEHGVIFFSLGSNVRSDKLSPEKLRAILAAFARLPQRVLWKFESQAAWGMPENVKIDKWLPQRDILAHPNTRLFVSHSGGLSTHEAVHRGVPVLGIPFLADQHINIRKLVRHGAAALLEYRELTEDILYKAIREMLDNPSYQENMRALSARFRDFPDSPLDRAVFWTEYVIRHKGARHLRPASLDLSFAQYFLLDVIAAALAVPVVLILLLKVLCCRKKSRDPKQKQS